MEIRGFIIKRASTLKAQIQEAIDAKEKGEYYDPEALYVCLGYYESRLFGLVIYRTIYSYKRLMTELTEKANKPKVYSTKQGKLYIKPNEFFKLPKIVNALKEWKNSDMVKEMDRKKKEFNS